MLGRLIPDYFPKIFGKTADQPLDVEASKAGFEKVAQEINEAFKSNLSLDEVVYGYGGRGSFCEGPENFKVTGTLFLPAFDPGSSKSLTKLWLDLFER